MNTVLQDILGLLKRKQTKSPKNDDYIILAAFDNPQEALKPNPRMQPFVMSLKTLKAWIASSASTTWGSITGTLSSQTDLQSALDGKVDENAAITGATKTKITYDAKGLVTSGADATTADIADSSNKRYVTDAQLTVIGNTSGTNSGNQTLANTSDSTSHTVTLSATGGSVKLVEGTGITLTTTGTSADGIITIAAGGGTPSGIAGAVQFSNVSAFASDATNFFWNNTNKTLLLTTPTNGTATSGNVLSLTAVNTLGSGTLRFYKSFGNMSIDSTGGIGIAAAGIMSISTAAYTDPVNIGGSYVNINAGSLGVNVASPTAKLQIKGSGATNATKSILIENSTPTETFSMSDSGIGLISNSLGINGGIGGSTYLGQIMRLAVNDFSRFGDIRIGGGFGSGVGYIQSDALNAIEFSSAQIRFCSGWIASANVLKLGTTVQRGRIEINTLANYRAAVIQADAAQIVPLVEFRNSANTQLSYIGAKGEIYVGSGTISASAAIQADSTTQGFLMPRMTTVERDAIVSPATGLEIYNTTTNSNNFYNGTAWEDTKLVTTNRQAASYTLVLGDANKLVEMNVATANNLTVPLNSTVAYSIGTQILISQYGAGQTTVVATGGVTIRSSGGKLKLTGQYSGATLIKIATDEWYCFGDLSA